MSDIFCQNRQENSFDNLAIEVSQLYDEHPIEKKEKNAKPNHVSFAQTPFHRVYRNHFIPIKYRHYAYHALRRINLDLSWFEEFNRYWTSILHGRTFWGIQDLFFLKNLYRLKFQHNQVPDTDDPYMHLSAWQRPEIMYQLLHLVCREAVSNQVYILKHLQWLKGNITNLTLLEFGCATAPVTASLYEFYKTKPGLKVYISDMQTLAFHYAAYRVRHCSNVIPLLLTPENNFRLEPNDDLDAIFCIAVFEHLNNPMDTIKVFYETLRHNGLLFFDYVKSDGVGMDSKHSKTQRNDVIDFINKNFELVHGNISKDKDMGFTIVKKG